MKQLFFHTKAAVGSVRATVAAEINNGEVRFGVSRCSEKDMFIKKIGRSRALGRASSSKPFMVTELPDANIIPWFVDKAKVIAQEVINNSQIVRG